MLGSQEDSRDGFKYGGWAGPYNDEVKARIMGEGMAEEHALLFGRKTYEHFFKVFPGRRDNPFSEVLDNTQKYVTSRTLREPLPWKNSTWLSPRGRLSSNSRRWPRTACTTATRPARG